MLIFRGVWHIWQHLGSLGRKLAGKYTSPTEWCLGDFVAAQNRESPAGIAIDGLIRKDLGGGFKKKKVSPLFGEDSHFD